jgi:hypothetical protein
MPMGRDMLATSGHTVYVARRTAARFAWRLCLVVPAVVVVSSPPTPAPAMLARATALAERSRRLTATAKARLARFARLVGLAPFALLIREAGRLHETGRFLAKARIARLIVALVLAIENAGISEPRLPALALAHALAVHRVMRLHLRLRSHDDAVVVFCVLQVIFRQHLIAGCDGIPCQGHVLFGDMRRCSTDLYVRPIRLEIARQRILPFAIASATTPVLLTLPHEAPALFNCSDSAHESFRMHSTGYEPTIWFQLSDVERSALSLCCLGVSDPRVSA